MFSLKESGLSLCILGGLCLLFNFNFVNGQLQCPVNQTTIVNDTVEFGSLFEGSGPVDTSYDPGAIGGWNFLANGFIDTVQREPLPFDTLVSVINGTFIGSSQGFEPLSVLQNFAGWWAGILVVTLLGIFFGILFLIVGSCFWCCRCCGKCGGAKTQRIREKNDCLTFTFAAILLLCTLVLLAGAVLAFFSNEQTYRSVDNFQTTLNTIVQDGSNYLSDTTRELDDLICQATSNEGVLAAVVGEIDNLQQELVSNITSISTQISDLIIQLNNSAIPEVTTLLDDITSSVSMVNMTLNSVVSDLSTAQSELDQAVSNCTSIPGADCSPIIEVRAAVNMSLSQIPIVPDVSEEIGRIQDAFAIVRNNIRDGLDAIDTLSSQVLDQIEPPITQITMRIEDANNSFVGLSDMLNQVVNPIINTTFPASSCPPLDGFEVFSRVYFPQFDFSSVFGQGGATTSSPFSPPSGSFELTLGYVNECVVNTSFEYIRQFDVYRYAVGIVICCLALITIVLLWAGLLFGLMGFRKDRYPHDRSKISHCGGIFLMVSVGLTFLFGFLLLLISGIFFFLGSNSLKLCQSLQGPNYEIFANTIDQPAIKSALLRGDPIADVIPPISIFLRDCEQNNTALYTAIDLDNILQTFLSTQWAGSINATLMQQFNLSSLQETTNSMISDIVSNLNLDQVDVVINSTMEAINSFPNGSLDFNVTAYIEEFEGAVATADLNNSIASLQNVSEMLRSNNRSDLADTINSTANILVGIQGVSLVNLRVELTQLNNTVDGFLMVVDNLQRNVTAIGNEIIDFLTNITAESFLENIINQTVRRRVDRSFGFLSQYISHLDDQIVNSVGGCQPIAGVYTQMHNTVCRNFLDGLNGFWWSLGFCSLLFIPVIIFAVITASFFLRKKSAEEDEDGYLAYPMKSY